MDNNDTITNEEARLRAIFPKILQALGSGRCTPNASIEFLEMIPNEIEAVVKKLNANISCQWQSLDKARHNACSIQNLKWGNDGDCGAVRLANLIEDECVRGLNP